MTSPLALPLDHLVINTRFEIGRAARLFASLGFTLTPQGRHPMGSVNHLLVFQDDYLELIGLPTDGGRLRPEILNSPLGIDGLVFKTHDAQRLHAELSAEGEVLQPLHFFSRPLELDGKTLEARFRVVRFQPGQFDAGRVYFCQHETPELVWRPSWQTHANTVTGLAGLVIVSRQPETDAGRYAHVAGGCVANRSAGDEFRINGAHYSIIITSPDGYRRRYGDLACDGQGRASFFGAVALRVSHPAALAQALASAGNEIRQRPIADHSVVSLTGFNSLLDFIHGDELL